MVVLLLLPLAAPVSASATFKVELILSLSLEAQSVRTMAFDASCTALVQQRAKDRSVLTIDSTSSGIMEAASYLLTNHSLVAKAIERDEFKPEGDLDAVL